MWRRGCRFTVGAGYTPLCGGELATDRSAALHRCVPRRFVNSAVHIWGKQVYDTSDSSRNNWWVALLVFGDGWHNNHHAFEYSARHGLEWWQLDLSWLVIRGLERLGLAYDVKLPTPEAMAEKRLQPLSS